MEGGEGVVNRNSMSNPLIAQQVLKLNAVGNGGYQSMYGGGGYLTEERVIEIASTIVKSTPVIVSEQSITEKQREVTVREQRFTVA